MVLGLVCSLAAVACGIGTESNAHVFRADEVPAGILDRELPPTTQAGTSTTLVTIERYRLFFVRSGALFEVNRVAAGLPTPSELVDSLSDGPTTSEIAAGFRSALGTSTVVAGVRTNGALAQVDLARTFAEIPRLEQTLAIGQITLTLTDRSDIVRVQFTMANVTIDVPKGNGSLTHEPVGADDFRELVRLPTGPTTTVAGSGPSGAGGATGPSGASGPTGASGATGANGQGATGSGASGTVEPAAR